MAWNADKKKGSHDPRAIYRDAARGVRLQRVMVDGGIASRRKCEELITEGDVRVNGIVVDFLPAWVDIAQDKITVKDRKLKFNAESVYIMYYKPRGIVCTASDPEGRRCVGDIVHHHSGTRIFPIGRLDMESQGLLLLTNDRQLTNQLTHPKHEVPKVYEVTVKGTVEQETLEKLRKGIFISDVHTRHDEQQKARRAKVESVELVRTDRGKSQLKIELSEGRNRQIRRILAIVGHPVKRLRRVQIGPLELKGLRTGQWRDLLPQEITAIKKAAKAT
ncbi:MAG: rRNA pseudouridine synthase [Phycisphaerae bacterium]|jgi:23S rRNA pseudouridine2605 synthase|nr:rRNA pseudouridine synthase [Phycisphaerae bacterium]HJN71386.1 pseudouridine synthase [Phycisphaerales bacterium]|tara:strand:+ start:657 stop:1484 length:828 start_codon:yes stop_codon:yes gene_type:complete